MDRESLFQWITEQYGVEPDYPWSDDNAVFRHIGNQKWFALVMNIGRDKLGLREEGRVDVLNIKCDPRLSGVLRTQPGYHPAYHMNKEQWLTLRLDGSVPEAEVKNLLSLSYDLTRTRPKAKRNRNG